MLDGRKVEDDENGDELNGTNSFGETTNHGLEDNVGASLLQKAPTKKQNLEVTKQTSSSSNKKNRSELRKTYATASFATRSKLEVAGDEDEEDDPDIIAQLVDKTPTTKRRIIQQENVKKQKKLGPLATIFTIIKGFVCTGILYMPKDFVNGGYGFSVITIIGCLFLTLYCAKLLLEVYDKVGGTGGSLPDIGYRCYGKPGKILVDISLFTSQFGFVCAYIYFITS